MNALGNMLVCGLIQVTLVTVVGLIVVAVCSRWSRTAATTPAALALGAVVVLTLIALSPWPSWLNQTRSRSTTASIGNSAESIDTETEHVSDVHSSASEPIPFGIREAFAAGIDGLRKMNAPVSETTESHPGANVVEITRTDTSWRTWFSWLFAGGVICGLIRLIGGLWGVHHFVRASRPIRNPNLQEKVDLICAELSCRAHVEIRECPTLATAATVGWRRPVILISETWKSWSDEQLRSVLAHEIAHISRGDFAASVAAQLGLVLHFYHPLVHWLVNRLRLEQELAADAIAAKIVGGSQIYLRAIGELALTQSKEHVGWPAHTFLPTRRTFLRRIEMLRDLKLLSDPAPLALRVSSIVAVIAITLFAVGLRPPGGDSLQTVSAAQPAETTPIAATAGTTQTSPAVDLEAKYVPANALAVAVFRPKEFATVYVKARESATSGPTPSSEKENMEILLKCNLAVAVMQQPVPGEPEQYAIALMFDDKQSRDAASKLLSPVGTFETEQLLLAEYEVTGGTARYLPNETTLILGGRQVVEYMIATGPSSLSPLTQTDGWKATTKQSAAIAIDAVSLDQHLSPDGTKSKPYSRAPANPFTGLLSPLWTASENHTIGVTLGESATIALTSTSRDDKGAKVVETTLNAGIAMLTGMIAQAKGAAGPPEQAKAISVLGAMLASHELKREGNVVRLTLTGDASNQSSALVGVLAPAILSSRMAAQKTQQLNNMKQIMLALHNYHDLYNHFPPAVVIDKEFGVPRSWRVEILPFIEGAAPVPGVSKERAVGQRSQQESAHSNAIGFSPSERA